MRLRNEKDPWNTTYTVLTDGGKNLGRVSKETSSRARCVSGVGGVTRRVARTPDDVVVSKSNTYTRKEAIEQLERYWEEQEEQ
jgi:hypothetical protein